MPAIVGENGITVRVYESSNAEGPHLWLRLTMPDDPVTDSAVELTITQAWQLAEQLVLLVTDHYQGDARPSWNDRVIDLLNPSVIEEHGDVLS
jgi:hypothetical protein